MRGAWVCISSALLLSACAGNTPVGRLLRNLRTVSDFLAWVCPVLFGVVFVGGGLVAFAKTLRAPTERSRAWAKRTGFVNIVFGALVIANAVFTPPRDTITQTVPTGQLEETTVVGSNVIESRPVLTTREVAGDVDLPSMLFMFAVGVGLAGLGAASVWSARRKP